MIFPVGIDIRMIRHTGIGTYVRGLLESWWKAGSAKEMGMALFGEKKYAPPWESLPLQPFRSPIYSVQEQLEYPFCLRRCRLWHAPHYNIPLIPSKTKLVVTIHDLIHWIFRKDFFTPLQAFYVKTMLERAAQTADHVITVSEKTRRDLIDHFNFEPERISVIYEGVSERFHELEEDGDIHRLREKYKLPAAYFLYVGSLKPHKNVLWLIHLFRKLKQEGKMDADLVVVGKKDKRYPVGYQELASLRTERGMVYIPFLEEKELVALYNGALALIHPSLYEGFGLTLLEAMACGTPVIACRSASVPEVVGEAAYLVDSCAERDMAEAMVRVEKVAGLRDELRRKGKKRIERFRWDQAAAETAEIYERVLSEL